ncbi:hypothetical protein HYPBUDRAFT_109643 [Hyphopichia burtonii NRRL Y-1933]|uniref:F-box domain-containing protein n=1 Tax=Hyphopichia burtonii NRRL Y-1933 TaxID=984485 RepID=A0A1E4RIW5_9ASCO|nr:hypothetical protein HYPBUDRAFT_109643 [Hyphopichia burtonii NRRL Y-1933]ODV67214.1 hypothetical protein HYPBUDRAFT_109643 [Hyphopichia burtonii NRRL Y-1933]
MSVNSNILEDKISLAVLYFKSSQYVKALKLYSEIIRDLLKYDSDNIREIRRKIYHMNPDPVMGPLVHPKLSSILDQRAATYEKLAQYQEAMKDAEKIIKCDPLGCKGYLRSGKLYLRQDRELEAFKVFQKGVYTINKAKEKFNIQVPDKLWTNLKSQYTNVNKQLKTKRKVTNKEAPKANSGSQKSLDEVLGTKRASSLASFPSASSEKSIDPVECLPLEILELIFSQINLKRILSCHVVSRLWRTCLMNIPSLYSDRVIFKNRITINEFLSGFKIIKQIVSKTYSKEIKQLKLRSTFDSTHAPRILDYIFGEKNTKYQSLDIINKDFSMELLVNKLNKFNWNVDQFCNLKVLRMGINASLKYEELILGVMKELNTLEIVVIDKKFNNSNRFILPSEETIQKHQQGDPITYSSLEKLTLVNHPHLNKQFIATRPGADTYDPAPPFITREFPNLTSLTIVSFDFTEQESNFGNFLSKSHYLKKLYLENNEGLTIKNLMMLISMYQPLFKLSRLTMREKSIGKAISLRESDPDYFSALYDLEILDLYSSSLSIGGLTKLLDISNRHGRLQELSIGNSNYIYFKNDRITTRPKIDLETILSTAPGLSKLSLNELDLDDSSMRFFHKSIHEVIGLKRCNLKVLDLSFCVSLTGAGLMNLFRPVLDTYSKSTNSLSLEELIVDGVEINEETLKSLMKSGYISNIRNDHFRQKWKQYGINTLVPDVSR